MLKYLMKYDLKKMFKLLIWFYGIAIILAGMTRILDIWSDIQAIRIVEAIFAGLTYSAIANILINTFIHILMRFTNSFYKDESYLTHTLPVKKDSLILSKYLSSLIVILSSVVISFLSLFIIFYTPEFMQGIKTMLDTIVSDLNMSSGAFFALIVLILSSQICAIISMAFTAIVKGNTYNHKKGLYSFLWFVVYYVVCAVITLVLIVIATAITGNIDTLFAEKMSSGALLSALITGLIAYIGFAILFFFLSRKLFNKGVNVD